MIEVKPVFIEKTKNVRNFSVMMDGLALGRGEGRLGMIYGGAGRGKTKTAMWYHANYGKGVFLRMQTIWQTSSLDFLQSLCRELGFLAPPGRKGKAFMMVVDALVTDPKPIFLDEIEKLPKYFLDVVRDLSDLSTAPVILIGEEELVSYMRMNSRVWSRTYQTLGFLPVSKSDIVAYFREAAELSVDNEIVDIFHAAATDEGGDFRVVRRGLLALSQIANAKQTDQVTADMAQVAVKAGLKGKKGKG